MTAHQFTDLIHLKPQTSSRAGCIERVLRSVRTHLNMDVAFISHFRSEDRIFTFVDAQGESSIKQGDVLPLSVGYCQRVVEGTLPELIIDTAEYPVAMALPETRELPIGSHMSVPIYLSDGTLYGTFCCFAHEADGSLSPRDMQVMKVFAELVTEQIEAELKHIQNRMHKHQRISAAMASDQLSIVYQPIFDAQTLHILGWECLSRFAIEPIRSPDKWFQDAEEAGLGVELECLAIEMALTGLRSLPSSTYLTLNCSPKLIDSGRLMPMLEGYPADRLVLEITEHAVVADYELLHRALTGLREKGIRLAIDDAGAGYASMRHILQLNPDIIKLDMSLTRGIDQASRLRAMASALIAFARETGSSVVAEGVETHSELETLRELGVRNVQGYLLGKPMKLEEAMQISQAATGHG